MKWILSLISSFFIPRTTLVGMHAAQAIPDRLEQLGGQKPLIVTDQGIVKTGILKQITDILDDHGMKYEVYDGTVPNPTTRNVNEATAVYKEKGCDSLISLGGGSSMTAARAWACSFPTEERFRITKGSTSPPSVFPRMWP